MAGALLSLMLAAGCKRHELSHHEYMYVSAAETSLRDRVATMYNKLGTVHNGDRVEVLEKQRRFLRVRTDSGQEGWIEERSLVPQEIYDGFQKLAQDNANIPVQAHGTTRAELNIHLTPSREAEHLYQLKDGENVEILKRATAEKNPPKVPAIPKPAASNAKPGSSQKPGSTPAATQPPKAPPPAAPAVAPKTNAAAAKEHHRLPSPSWKTGIWCEPLPGTWAGCCCAWLTSTFRSTSRSMPKVSASLVTSCSIPSTRMARSNRNTWFC